MKRIVLIAAIILVVINFPSICTSFNDYDVNYYNLLTKANIENGYIGEKNRDLRQYFYDAEYYELNFSFDISSTIIFGDVLIKCKSLTDDLDAIVFDLQDNLEISGITGDYSSYTHEDNIITIIPTTPYNENDYFEYRIEYSGNPQEETAYGMRINSSIPCISNVSAPFFAHYFFPCKDVPSDKADSVDINMTVPSELTAVSNGNLVSTEVDGNNTTYKWEERYPIATYLIAVNISNFATWEDTYHGTQDMPVQFYVFPSELEQAQETFEETVEALEFFTDRFGLEYPFIEEKYAVARGLFGGGMENQTVSLLGSTASNYYYINIHEASHQWFGDYVTYEDFHHCWITEGSATYSEALWAEYKEGMDAYHQRMAGFRGEVSHTKRLYVDEATSFAAIYDRSTVYTKGAWVFHMLRGVLGDDLFFGGLAHYLNLPELAYGYANTEILQTAFEEYTGQDLEWFFEQWVYGYGAPSIYYTLFTGENSSVLNTYLEPFEINGNITEFEMPIEISLDSEPSVFNMQSAFNSFNIDEVISTIETDPDNWVLLFGNEEQLPEIQEISALNGGAMIAWEPFEYYTGHDIDVVVEISEDNLDFSVAGQTLQEDGQIIIYELNPGTQYYVRLRYSNGFISAPSPTETLTAISFPFDQDLMLIDETHNGSGSPVDPTDEAADNFYHDILANYEYTEIDYSDDGFPGIEELSHYKCLVWHNDDMFNNFLSAHENEMKSYLLSGGKLILSNWKEMGQFDEVFLNDYLYVDNITNTDVFFASASGSGDFATLEIDPDKITVPTWDNSIPNVNVFEAIGSREYIYTYNSLSGTSQYDGQCCGALYENDVFSALVLGFPLYHIRNDQAKTFIEAALAEMGINTGINEVAVNSKPTKLSMFNYPNPFNPVTTINLSIPDELNNEKNTLSIFNLKGQSIKSWLLDKGCKSILWDGTNNSNNPVSSGVYFYKLISGNKTLLSRKMLLLK